MLGTGRKRILVVDDDEDVLIALETLFENEGYDTTTAWTGHEALDLLGSRAFDLVLVDGCLPDLDSKEILKKIQGMPIRPLVIVMEAQPSFDDLNRFELMGAADVVGKWMPRRRISQAVRDCLASATLQKACLGTSLAEAGASSKSKMSGPASG